MYALHNKLYAYDRGNYEAMKDELSTVEWKSEFREKSLNEKWTFMKDKVHSCVKKHVPETKNYSTKSKHKPLWMNRIAVKAVRKNTDLGKSISKHVKTYIFSITVETEMLLQGMQKSPTGV